MLCDCWYWDNLRTIILYLMWPNQKAYIHIKHEIIICIVIFSSIKMKTGEIHVGSSRPGVQGLRASSNVTVHRKYCSLSLSKWRMIFGRKRFELEQWQRPSPSGIHLIIVRYAFELRGNYARGVFTERTRCYKYVRVRNISSRRLLTH